MSYHVRSAQKAETEVILFLHRMKHVAQLPQESREEAMTLEIKETLLKFAQGRCEDQRRICLTAVSSANSVKHAEALIVTAINAVYEELPF